MDGRFMLKSDENDRSQGRPASLWAFRLLRALEKSLKIGCYCADVVHAYLNAKMGGKKPLYVSLTPELIELLPPGDRDLAGCPR